MVWKVWCPIIKDRCVNGHNKIMGEDETNEKVRCMKWMKLAGIHPQTGQAVDEWKCKEHWDVLLAVENAKETRETAASVDSHRNVFLRAMTRNLNENDIKEIESQRRSSAIRDSVNGGHPSIPDSSSEQ